MNAMNESPLLDYSTPAAMHTPEFAGPSPFASRLDLEAVLTKCAPIPAAAAFLGIALDGLPVLLNLRDPSPGPILISGDPGTGKRRLLQVIARFADFSRPTGGISHAILTDHVSDWEAIGQSDRCEGVLPFHHPLAAGYIKSLASSGRSASRSRPYLLLIVDGLEILASEPELRGDMLQLFQNGPSKGIWPIVSINMPHTPAVTPWLQPFQTVLCSRTPAGDLPSSRLHQPASPQQPTSAEAQFALLSNDDWLPFWVPDPL